MESNGSEIVVHRSQRQALGVIDYGDTTTIDTIKNTLAIGATDDELNLFLEVCKSTGLNPFTKEIWFIKDTKRNRMHIMVGVNGFYRVANKHPQYDGLEREYGPEITINIKEKTKKVPSWVETAVYRKDRSRPHKERAYWDDFVGQLTSQYGNPMIWWEKGRIMLDKCADSLALRKSFPQELNGLYTEEEMSRYMNEDGTDFVVDVEASPDESAGRANYQAQLADRLERGEDYVIAHGQSLRGQKLSEITQGPHLKNHLEKYRDQMVPIEIEVVEARLEELREEYRRRQEEAANADPLLSYTIVSQESDFCGQTLGALGKDGCKKILEHPDFAGALSDEDLENMKIFATS